MLIDQNNDQFIMDFLNMSQKDADKFLINEDQKYVLWKHNELIQKMPSQLKPTQAENHKYTNPILNSLISIHANSFLKQKSAFPSMFNSFDHKSYNYQKSKIDTFIISSNKKVDTYESNLQVTGHEKLKRDIQIQNQMVLQHSFKPQNQAQRKRISPFIPASKNFTDIYSNSKSGFSTQNFMNPASNCYNLLSFAQKKKVQAFSNDFSYPNTIMKGNINNPFKNVFQQDSDGSKILDVESVMKYTLNGSQQIKRPSFKESSLSKKSKNPFVLVPQKYGNDLS